MLLAYLDESGTHGSSPNTVMAGFAGTQEQWDGFIPEWQSVLQKYGRRNLHMKRLRFSSPKEQEMLAELGALPLKHKLLMLATYVETDAHNRITVLSWHRKLVASKYDGSSKRNPGRTRIQGEVEALVIRMAGRPVSCRPSQILAGVLFFNCKH